MKIITAYPVLYKNNVINRGGSEYSNITAASNKDSITSFQNWYNKNVANSQTKLVVDGIWGPKTNSAWKQKGERYETEMLGATNDVQKALAGLFGGAAAVADPQNISLTSPTGEKKDGMVWDKTKQSFVDPKTGSTNPPVKTNSVGLSTAKPDVIPPIITKKPDDKTGSSKEQHGSGRMISKTAKILIGCGIGFVLVFIIYKVTKTKK